MTLQNETLTNAETGQKVGIARKQQEGRLQRVFATVSIDPPRPNKTYHGWLVNPVNKQTRYAGEMFATIDGYSITYTTEENIDDFAVFQVSSESASSSPESPANNLIQWNFSNP